MNKEIRKPGGDHPEKIQPQEGQMICPSCGAPYDKSQPACPYCGAMNYPASEERYFQKMDRLREEMENLKEVPGQETGKQLARTGRKLWWFLAAALALIAVLFTADRMVKMKERSRDREDYVWKSENYPVLDQYYESGDYDAMLAFFREVSAAGKPVWDWKHAELCMAFSDMEVLDGLYVRAEEFPEDEECRRDILYEELSLLGIKYHQGIPKEDMEIITERSRPYLEDLRGRFALGEEQISSFEEELKKNYGYPELKKIEEYLEKAGGETKAGNR